MSLGDEESTVYFEEKIHRGVERDPHAQSQNAHFSGTILLFMVFLGHFDVFLCIIGSLRRAG
jgi:hypothetical protein